MQNAPTVEETIYMTKFMFSVINQYIIFLFHFNNRSTNICIDKCVKRFGEEDLQPPEKTCIDRCAKKYLDLYTNSVQKLGEAGQQMVAQAQAQK